MKKSHHTVEQIILILREADGSEQSHEDICRRHNISPQTFYRWKSKYGGMGLSEAQRLRELGYEVNKKLVQRIRREEGLQVPAPKPRQRRRGVSTGLPQRAGRKNQVWAWDFVSDYTERGGRLRTFNLIDEYTRECHCIHADRQIGAADVLRVLREAIARHGAPEYIRSDNEPEFIAKAVQRWLKANRIKTIYIEPGCPWQNGYAESFNGRFRRECLNRELLYTLRESRVVFEDWRQHYNEERPHRSLGLQTPAQFAQSQALEGSGSSRATPSLRRNLEVKQSKANKQEPPNNLSSEVD